MSNLERFAVILLLTIYGAMVGVVSYTIVHFVVKYW